MRQAPRVDQDPVDLFARGVDPVDQLAFVVRLEGGDLSALVRGLPVKVLEIALLLSLAAAISVSTRVIGALPTFGFSVLPAMAAIRLAPNVQLSLLGATLIGAGCGFMGYLAAYLWEFPVGAAQTLTGVALVIVVEVVQRLFRRR